MTDVKTVTVEELPECYFCKVEGKENPEPAEYDGKTTRGPWAYMCQSHFDSNGVGLGTGRGQKLVLPTKQPDERIAQADAICRQCGQDCPEGSWNRETVRFRLIGEEAKIIVMVSTGLYCEEI